MSSLLQKENNILLEKLLIRTPIGLRFWDHGAGKAVNDHLEVKTWPREGGQSPIHAMRNPSGIYSFHGLPGLRDWEYPIKDEELGASPPFSKQFIVKIEDTQRRFLNVAAIMEAPQPDDRIFVSNVESPVEADKGFRLFSAPTRSATSYLAMIRAYLWDKSKNKAASYAVLKVSFNGNAWTGIADENGMIAVLFPYPIIMRSLDVSPPSSRIPLHEQSWEIKVRAFYGGTDMTHLPYAKLPNLAHILKQTQVKIYETEVNFKDELSVTLTIGQELVLRTSYTDTRDQGKLLIKSVS